MMHVHPSLPNSTHVQDSPTGGGPVLLKAGRDATGNSPAMRSSKGTGTLLPATATYLKPRAQVGQRVFKPMWVHCARRNPGIVLQLPVSLLLRQFVPRLQRTWRCKHSA